MPAIHISTFETRCSYCDSTRSVTAEELNAQAGLLACGECGKTFNAAWNLVDQIPHPTNPYRPASPKKQKDEQATTASPPAMIVSDSTFDRFEEQVSETLSDLPESRTGRLEPRLQTIDDAGVAEDSGAIPRSHQKEPAKPSVWPALGLALAIVALIVQVRFTLLDELASVPAVRPYIALFCRHTGCELPQSLDGPAITVTRSEMDLHRTQPSALVIRVHLANRSRDAQSYPALEISLNDAQGQLLGRRTYLPSEFGVIDASQKIGPEREAVVTLILARADAMVTGLTAQAVRS